MKTKVEPHSLDPAEEPLIWEGLTLNKCILVASIIALLSVSFQVLQGELGTGPRCRVPQRQGGQTPASSPPSSCPLPSSPPAPPCSRDGVSSSRQEPPAPPVPGGFRAGRARRGGCRGPRTPAHPSPSPELTVTKEEAPEVEAPQPIQPESSMLEDDDSDDDGDDDDNDADSNLVWG